MLTRRDLLRLGATGAAAGCLGSLGCASAGGRGAPPSARPDFTAAFLTDPHVFEQKGAADGTARAVEHALAQRPAPELVLTGGDLAFDILETGEAEADRQYDLFDAAVRPVKVPIHYVLGNHDCFGVYEQSGVKPDHPLFGKGYFNRRYGLERAYYSFDHEGWHFVVLDTIGVVERSYRGFIDAEQIAWLDDDLAAAARPTVVIGHVPLFSNYIEWLRGTSEGIPDRLSVVNCHEVAPVLVKHGVKLVIAGHLHVNETFEYKGVRFANIGAVSGNWWDGLRDGFEEGYAVLEFRGESVDWRYVDYGWEAQAEPAA